MKNDTWLDTALAVLFYVVVGSGVALLLVEWAAGCGESWVDATGVQHQNECVWVGP